MVKAQGEFPAARALYEQSLEESRAIADRPGAAVTLGNLGDLAREQGDAQAARAFYDQSLAAFRALGDPGDRRRARRPGGLAREQGDFGGSPVVRESMEFSRASDTARDRPFARRAGVSAGSQGDARAALRLAGAAAALREALARR